MGELPPVDGADDGEDVDDDDDDAARLGFTARKALSICWFRGAAVLNNAGLRRRKRTAAVR